LSDVLRNLTSSAVSYVAEPSRSVQALWEGLPLRGLDVQPVLDEVVESIRSATKDLVDKLAHVVGELDELVIKTHATSDLEAALAGSDRSGALSAITRVTLNGDMQVVVPAEAGALPAHVWQAHQESVSAALAGRAQSLQAVTAAIRDLLQVLNPAQNTTDRPSSTTFPG
jgi:hypothetical protein